MANCHQCNQDTGAHERTGNCKICHSKNVAFCQKCAMWELGPSEADVGLARKLRKAKKVVEVQRQDRDKPKVAVSKLADQPLRCKVFLPTMGEVCPFFKAQLSEATATLYGKQFKSYTCDVLHKFQKLYKTCKYDRLAIQVLIAVHLSSQERVQCRDSKDKKADSTSDHAKPVKRWETRTIARKHLEHHLEDVKDQLGQTIHDIVSRPAWLLALGCDDLELYLKGFKHPTLAAIDLLAAAGGNATVAREALEVFTIVYHALTATRTRDEAGGHWSSAKDNASFCAKEALGMLSKAHFEALYGDVDEGEDFSPDMTKRIEKLWNVLGDATPANVLPAHPRFADGTVSGSVKLDGVEKNYFQYLPRFDHPHSQVDQRTPCEVTVRTRVKKTLKKYLKEYGPLEWYKPRDVRLAALQWHRAADTEGKTKTLVVAETTRNAFPTHNVVFGPDGLHASKKLSDTVKKGLEDFVQQVLAEAETADRGCEVQFEITGEEGNSRRTARRTAVEQTIQAAAAKRVSWRPDLVDDDGKYKDDASVRNFLDALMTSMKTGFCVDQAFDLNVANIFIDKAEHHQAFTPMAWFPLKLRDKPYTELFPDCDFDASVLPTINEHYTAVAGTSPRPAHYMDWRNHKDLWLYDCFAIAPTRRPVFASLSQQPYLPLPNTNYGYHILYYKRDQTHDRSIYTFGDKQQPRRSMLLILDTVLHGRAKKDGDDGQNRTVRRQVIHNVLARHDAITFYSHLGPDALWDKTFKSPKVIYFDGDTLIECHIFGGVSITNDAWGFVAGCETGPAFDAQNHLDLDDFNDDAVPAIQGVYPTLHVLQYRVQALKNKQATSPGFDAWKDHLSELEEVD